MPGTSYSTPLVGLDAVVLDTETTGLDARTARIVQIGAVRMHGPKILPEQKFERFVNPGVPIPAATIAVHGIADGDVSHAPPFAAVLPELEKFIGSSIVIGHTIAYDMGVLRREYEVAGKVWRPPRALDVRILAKLAAPTLAHHSLDRLCDWLGIEMDARHTALGDAEATGRVFAALLPLLRQRNIRTLAEAEAATRALAEQEARAAGGLVAEIAGPAAEAARPLVRIDSYPYRHRLREVMSEPPAFLEGDASLATALHALMGRKISSVFVRDASGETGILTEHDVLRALDTHGAKALELPIREFASRPVQSVSEDAFVYRAIGRMDRLGVRHLAVRNPTGEIVGAVTSRDLLHQRASTAIVLGDEIDSATDVAVLGTAWAKLPHMAKSLLEEGVDPRTIAQVISSEICNLTRRAAQIGESRMLAAGRGEPPVRYCVLVLGSAGRGESLLNADQDNAIVFASGEPGGVEDAWFAELGGHIADILDAVGVPYCKGGVMAKNAAWRHSLAGWKDVVNGWVRRHRPEDLLNVDIFFDAVPVHGDAALGEAIWSYAYATGHRSPEFVKLLSVPAQEWSAPFTLFGGIRVDAKGRVDLKKGGLMPIFTGVRVLSVRYDARSRATPDRLRAVIERGVGSPAEVEEVIAAHRVLLGVILDQQLADTEVGIPLSPKVEPDRLDRHAKLELKEALTKVQTVVDMIGGGRL